MRVIGAGAMHPFITSNHARIIARMIDRGRPAATVFDLS
jgi:hypothetical protein